MSKFTVGDKVYLQETSQYNNGSFNNPLNTEGEVIEVLPVCKPYDNGFSVIVKWSDKFKNHYRDEDLRFTKPETFKVAFKVGDKVCLEEASKHNDGGVWNPINVQGEIINVNPQGAEGYTLQVKWEGIYVSHYRPIDVFLYIPPVCVPDNKSIRYTVTEKAPNEAPKKWLQVTPEVTPKLPPMPEKDKDRYCFTGEFRVPKRGEHYLSDMHINILSTSSGYIPDGNRYIATLIETVEVTDKKPVTGSVTGPVKKPVTDKLSRYVVTKEQVSLVEKKPVTLPPELAKLYKLTGEVRKPEVDEYYYSRGLQGCFKSSVPRDDLCVPIVTKITEEVTEEVVIDVTKKVALKQPLKRPKKLPEMPEKYKGIFYFTSEFRLPKQRDVYFSTINDRVLTASYDYKVGEERFIVARKVVNKSKPRQQPKESPIMPEKSQGTHWFTGEFLPPKKEELFLSIDTGNVIKASRDYEIGSERFIINKWLTDKQPEKVAIKKNEKSPLVMPDDYKSTHRFIGEYRPPRKGELFLTICLEHVIRSTINWPSSEDRHIVTELSPKCIDLPPFEQSIKPQDIQATQDKPKTISITSADVEFHMREKLIQQCNERLSKRLSKQPTKSQEGTTMKATIKLASSVSGNIKFIKGYIADELSKDDAHQLLTQVEKQIDDLEESAGADTLYIQDKLKSANKDRDALISILDDKKRD